MKQKFFTDTIQSNFIKSLLYNTPVPLIKTVNDDSYIIKDNIYLYKNKIIKCLKSGIVKYPILDDYYFLVYKNGDKQVSFNFEEYNPENQMYGDDITGEGTVFVDGVYEEYDYTLGRIYYYEDSDPEYSGGYIDPWNNETSTYDAAIADWDTEASEVQIQGGNIVPWYGVIEVTVEDYAPQDGDILCVVFEENQIKKATNSYFKFGENEEKYYVKGFSSVTQAGITHYFRFSSNKWYYIGICSPILEGENKFEDLGYHLIGQSSYKILDDFLFGKYYPEFTELYISKLNYYDTETHEHLGNLLRCYRDLSEINLMPYYNCFSGNYVSHLLIDKEEVIDWDNTGFKVLKVPIKFNTTYTIAIDSSNPVKMAPALLSNNVLITSFTELKENNVTDKINLTPDLYNENIFVFDNLSFKNPVTVGIDIIDKETEKYLYQYEKYLYLLIQVTADNNSSVVVLEGDYTNQADITGNIFSTEDINNLTDLELSDIMKSDLSLLQMNDKISYPFADRLIEYLLLNVITSMEIISQNITRVQEKCPVPKPVKGVWDNVLRSSIYNYYQKQDEMSHLDLNGFVDKDTERLMKRIN